MLLVGAFGIGAGFLSLLPGVLIAGQGLAPRMAYTPLVCFAIAFGGLLAATSSLLPARTRAWLTATLAPVVIAGAIIGGITMVGLQKAYQLRGREDLAVMAQLKRLVPDPPPQTVFLPVRIEHWPTNTGMIRFDRLRPGAFDTIWSATAIVRQSYKRRDLWAAGCNPWRPPMIMDATTQWVRLDDQFVIWSPFPPDRRDNQPRARGTRLPWTNVLPFVVDTSGHVKLLKQVVFDPPPVPGAQPLTIEPPLVAQLLASKRIRPGAAVTIHLPNQP